MANTTTPNPNGTLTPKEPIIIRAGHLSDAYTIGAIAAKTYKDTGLSAFLSPHREKYYSDYERGFKQRALQRMFNARNLTFVACTAADPGTVIGYVQAVRLGDDEGAKRQIARRWSVWLWVFGWLFSVWCRVRGWVMGPSRAANKEAEKMFEGWVVQEEKRIWSAVPERGNRWHVQSCVVREEWQGRGIGTRLMKGVMVRGEEENVYVGVEASGPGEYLYRRVGFELLKRFDHKFDGDEVGGIMLWTPPGLKKE